ncbi:peptidoglycan DD-metalloendopeptidase family protein [Melghirimyces algeriensis]|uniref:Copper amine oxidase N-terminal domain-containing protein n=1 Tax=Melghirimyces algeriensis TaxID=910412 RepID=A0A521BQU3_9BACL|nr:peptidoglycan DD-metalloendopeptidase family protein [Melghirimyces algeriensis]SMO49121.1 Copper amine oxidase N-terminal domain-containing protein [Melghirimyces algeriensis]
MGKPALLIAVAVLSVLLLFFLPVDSFNGNHHSTEKSADSQSSSIVLDIFEKNEKKYLAVDEVEKKLGLHSRYKPEEGVLTLSDGSLTLRMLRGAPVVSRNGIYLPVDGKPLFRGEDLYIPLKVLEEGLGKRVEIRNGQAMIAKKRGSIETSSQSVAAASYQKIEVDELVRVLSFLDRPISGATVSIQDSHLPGAPRDYRNGVHEGLDYYSGTSTIQVDTKTPVVASADGVVVRADHNYRELSVKERNQLLRVAARHEGQTPAYILDKLRGRSVWVQHEKGILTRYAHLSQVSDHIQLGDRVKKGQLLGYVGNSGTRSGAEGTLEGLHLHFDILIRDHWFWGKYTEDERRDILRKVLDEISIED